MPRTYDFSAEKSPENYRNHGLFVPFLDGAGKRLTVLGKGEISLQDLWGPEPTGFLSGLRHQYDLQTPKGMHPYDNAVVDPIFAWLEEHCEGRWSWLEHEINNYRSVATEVYIESPDDQQAFEAAWGQLFQRSEHAFEHNAGLAAPSPAI